MLDLDVVTGMIVDSAYHVIRRAGHGMFESVYRDMLAAELIARGLTVERERVIPAVIDGVPYERAFRADLIVDGRVIAELKSVDRLPAMVTKQLITYLRLTGLQVGFVINFGAPRLKDGIKRVVNNYIPLSESPLQNGR